MRTNQVPAGLFVLWIMPVLLFCNCNNSVNTTGIEKPEDDVVMPAYTQETSKGISQGFKFNKNWAINVEAGANFDYLYTDSSGTTYAISNSGLIYSCKGNLNWKLEDIQSNYISFISIGGSGNDLYAVGNASTLLHKKATGNWEREKFPYDSLYFTAVYSFDNELWLATWPKGPLWHRNKAGVWEQELQANDVIKEIYGYGADLWALGYKAIYHKKPGGSWESLTVASEKIMFNTLYQHNNQVWVMGSGGNIFYNNGGKQWIKESAGDDNQEIYCSYGNQNEVYAAGNNGLLLHRLPGGKWVKEETGYHDFSAICMYGRQNNIWLGGSNGLIFHKNNNGAWTKEAGPIRGTEINAISSRGDTLIAAGQSATLLTSIHNAGWQKAVSVMPDTPFTSIFSFSQGILVGAKNGMLYHLKEDGKWHLENSHAGDIVFSDLYENEQSIYLVGNKGTITWRRKTDTAWTSTTNGAYDLIKIYGYDNNIFIFGNSSTLLHKKENEPGWKPINIGLTTVDFLDVYGWKGQLWALGILDKRGIIFHKDNNDNWTADELHKGLDHFHALYGHDDTIYAVGAYGDWASKDKTGVPYQGTIICKAGNNPWKVQLNRVIGIHFNGVSGTGNKIYALGSNGTMFFKDGDADWVQQETYLTNESLSKLIFYKGLIILSDKGFVYRENKERNFIRINRTGELINMVELNGELYCASRHGIFKLKPTVEKYPVIDKINYTLTPAINPSSITLGFALQYPNAISFNDNYSIELFAQAYNGGYGENKWIQTDASNTTVRKNVKTNTELISTQIEVVKYLRVIPGIESANKISLRIDVIGRGGLSRESFVIKDVNGQPYLTLNNNFWLNYKWWVIGGGAVILYYIFWLTYAFFFPLAFIRAYHSGKLQALIALKPPYHMFIGVINILLPLKKLVALPHVLNAWTRDFARDQGCKYDDSEIANQRNHYVPLPVRKYHPLTGPLIEKPNKIMLNELLNNKRAIVQIIGPGGSGKTSLAVEMGRWMIQSAQNTLPGEVPRVPILLESGSKDILNDITKILRSWKNDYTIQEDFVKILLKSQRLVVIADSLSERPAEIQEYFKQLHGYLPVNALIITSRQPVDLQVREGTCLYPMPLNSNNLLYYITTYLNNNTEHPVQESREQLAFTEKVLTIIEGNNNKALITPLLVWLIMEMAIKNGHRDFHTLMKNMPNSIAEAYYQYLAHMIPANPATANYLPRNEMLKIAEILGRLSLGDNFLPHDFSEEKARQVVAQTYTDKLADAVQQFIDSGILTQKTQLANNYLRFNLDQLAEYLAASRLYTEHNTSPEDLQAFIEQVYNLPEEAEEFKVAFSQICEYKIKHG